MTRAIIDAIRTLRIELVLTNERVLKVFTLTGLQSLFTIHATVAEAEAAYGAAQGGSGA